MTILVILPNWLGDAVMATPAIEALCTLYPDAQLTMVGSEVSLEAIKHHPQCVRAYVDETKRDKNRLKLTRHFAQELGPHDLAITFRKQLHASLLVRWSKSKHTIGRESWHSKLFLSHAIALESHQHLVEQYMGLVQSLPAGAHLRAGPLRLHIEPNRYKRPTVGINPGATYGSAKRWYPEKFADVARILSERYDVILFGGPSEVGIARDIESRLKGINVTNLAGKTSIPKLCAMIGGLDLFITNDSGPMHIAAAYQVPSVSIFGPTNPKETSQWMNGSSAIVTHDLVCAPCMKRKCPLKHHECMKGITTNEVIEAVKQLLAQGKEG